MKTLAQKYHDLRHPVCKQEVDEQIEKIARVVYAALQTAVNGAVDFDRDASYVKEVQTEIIKKILAEPHRALMIVYLDDQKYWLTKSGERNKQYILPINEWVNTPVGFEGKMVVNIVAALGFGAVAPIK